MTLDIIVAFILWLGEIILCGRTALTITVPQLAADELIFYAPSYNGVLFEQAILVNRRTPSIIPTALPSALSGWKRTSLPLPLP